LKSVDDLDIRNQVTDLIAFAQSAASLEKRDVQWAFTLANTIRGGVKRALLYAGIADAVATREDAFGYFHLGIKETESLPAEQRMLTLSALAGSMLRHDPDSVYLAVAQWVSAANHAYTSPHQGIFDPKVIHKIYSGKITSTTDSALILANRRHTAETVDTGLGRHNFALKVPGAGDFNLPAVLRKAELDPQRLEGILLSLRDETLLAATLNAVVAMRLGM
jgi:hypothetical protein